jgi:[ribosomal protein S5]-alanine N-acetyltransferase
VRHVLTTPLLETPRLVLTVPVKKDAARMARFVVENREHLKPWEPSREETYYTEAFWRAELAKVLPEFRAGVSLRLILSPKEDPAGPLGGTVNFRNFVWGAFRACHLGYSLDRRRQGAGLMREGLEAALGYVFQELGMHRVMAAYMPHNERSARLLTSLGFEAEGYAREYLHLDGAWRDHVLTARIAPRESGPT